MLTPEILSFTMGALILFAFIVIFLGRKKKLSITERVMLDKEKLAIETMLLQTDVEGNVTGKEKKLSWFDKKQKELERSGAGVPMPVYLGIAVVTMLLIYVVVQNILQFAPVAILFSLVGLLLPDMYVKMRVERNIRFFNKHLTKALRRATASMRSGNTITQALVDIVSARMLHPVIRAEFKKVLVDIEYGVSIEEAFYRLFERTGSKDVRFLAMTIEIKRRHGGNIGQTFEYVGSAISNRALMEADIRATLAQANATSMLLSAIPFVLSGALIFMSPDYFEPMFETMLGRVIFLSCYVMIILGAIVMKKMSKVRL